MIFVKFIEHTIPAIYTDKSSYYSLHSWASGRKKTTKSKESIKQKHSEFKGILILLFTTNRSIQFSFQSQRKAMPKNAQTTAQLHSSHMLVK